VSTYWYFECLDHTPPLVSDGEFTQHTDDDPFRRAVTLAQHRPVAGPWDGPPPASHFESNARRFLAAHPACRVGLVNEYGEHRPLPEPSAVD